MVEQTTRPQISAAGSCLNRWVLRQVPHSTQIAADIIYYCSCCTLRNQDYFLEVTGLSLLFTNRDAVSSAKGALAFGAEVLGLGEGSLVLPLLQHTPQGGTQELSRWCLLSHHSVAVCKRVYIKYLDLWLDRVLLHNLSNCFNCPSMNTPFPPSNLS